MKFVGLIVICLLTVACGGGNEAPPQNPPTPQPAAPPLVPNLPSINNVQQITSQGQRFEKVEFIVELSAQFSNPLDSREVMLNATFTNENDQSFNVLGFWDLQNNWRVRMSPNMVGSWSYSITVTDANGTSEASTDAFSVQDSDKKGWITTGDQINPQYSERYFVYANGEPFYGLGHGDAFSITSEFRLESSLNRLINSMQQAGENYIMWWPQFDFSLVRDNFDNYNIGHAQLIDRVFERFEQSQNKIVFTVWDHSQLRDNNHPWADGNWFNNNAFRQLVSANDFFTDEQAWQWQANLYRYMIARWGYSASLGLWQTVSEIEGTNALTNDNNWHERVNRFFTENDPFQHPTTASMAGDKSWLIGHAVMDIPQVHVYQDLLENGQAKVIETASVLAQYTQDMWQQQSKPNWIGEFGVINSNSVNVYPELFHNAIWSTFAAGAAMTPAEWNDFDRWEFMTDDMNQHMQYLGRFARDIPLARWRPAPTNIELNSRNFNAWALAGLEGGIAWVQDTRLAGQNINTIRQMRSPSESATAQIDILQDGTYTITLFNTWTGQTLDTFNLNCVSQCDISIPSFTDDIAIKFAFNTP